MTYQIISSGYKTIGIEAIAEDFIVRALMFGLDDIVEIQSDSEKGGKE